MSTTTTMSALNSNLFAPAPRISLKHVAQLRAALPQMPSQDSITEGVNVIGRFTLAAVPFAALGWLFIAN
jgi:hypothetical protein